MTPWLWFLYLLATAGGLLLFGLVVSLFLFAWTLFKGWALSDDPRKAKR